MKPFIKKLPSDYVATVMDSICLNGDSYTDAKSLFDACKRERFHLDCATFQADLAEQIRAGQIHVEGRRLYSTRTWNYEEHVAAKLAEILPMPSLPAPPLPEAAAAEGIALCEEQRQAVEMAVSNRLSIILGGAGSGKTTLIRAIVTTLGADANPVLCAPTGKAARNLKERTGLQARTVHSALGMRPDEDFLEAVLWPSVHLVVVDEASMMTLEMLAGVLEKASDECRVVLVGDPNQLQSVGSGNVLPDLLTLGVPNAHLEQNHRQNAESSALLHNVVNFSSLLTIDDLAFDESFQFVETSRFREMQPLFKEAATRYLGGESVQVLAPYRSTVLQLNLGLQQRINPLCGGKSHLGGERADVFQFHEGDRVIITQNDRDHNVCNGDVGILHIQKDSDGMRVAYRVELPDGRCPEWEGCGEMTKGLRSLELAYALTVHKSQGSEYDTVILPSDKSMRSMFTRNLFYTAISRAKRRVVIFGDRTLLESAMQKRPNPRKSMLVTKTRNLMAKAA